MASASRIGSVAQLIESNENGLLYPPGDVDQLALAISRLRNEPKLRRRLGHAARRKVLQEHTWSAKVQQIIALAFARQAALLHEGEVV